MPTYKNPLFAFSDFNGSEPIVSKVKQYNDGLLVIPEYQRGFSWTDEEQSKWVGYVVSGGPLPTTFVRQVDTPDGWKDEIIDGQHRLMALKRWLDGEIPMYTWDGRVEYRTEENYVHLARLKMPLALLPESTTDLEAVNFYLTMAQAVKPHTEKDLQPALMYKEKLES